MLGSSKERGLGFHALCRLGHIVLAICIFEAKAQLYATKGLGFRV